MPNPLPGILMLPDAQKAQLLREFPALQRRRINVSRLWGEAMNRMEQGWIPDAETQAAIADVGAWLSTTGPMQEECQVIIRDAVAQAIREGRLNPADVPAGSGLGELFTILVITAGIAAAIMYAIDTIGWYKLESYRASMRSPEINARASQIAAGMNVGPFNWDDGSDAAGVAKVLAPWMFVAALAALFVFRPRRSPRYG